MQTSKPLIILLLGAWACCVNTVQSKHIGADSDPSQDIVQSSNNEMGNTLGNHGEFERARYAPESEEQEKESKSFPAARRDLQLREFSEADDDGSEYGTQEKLRSSKNKADKFGQLIAHAFITKHSE
uniref:Secreted protein n=1 Tax=Ixodes scapularis TaxID=6945 RepID=A0A4D5S8X3_IXOSC